MKNCTPVWREAHFEVKMYEAPQCRSAFGSWAVEKVHAVVADWRGSAKMHFAWSGDTWVRHVRRSGRWFPVRGCILEHHIFRFAKMILRDRCSTSYDLASLFRGRRSTLDRWIGKIAKRIGTRASTWKIEEVSHCSVFDVANFENWGSLAELLSFSCCHLQKWRKPCRIASFSSFVFKLAGRQIDR